MLRLRCFGYPRIEGPDGQSLEAVQTHPKRFAVLIYLACHSSGPGAPMTQRETLLPIFWPDSDEFHARNCLRQTLHTLRGFLGREAVQSRNGDGLCTDPALLWCDVHAFGAAYREGRLQEAMNLANEAFLTGFYVPEGGQFMAWVDDRRRTLKEMAIDAARRLAREADTASNPHQAVGWWFRSLELSPYDEEILISLVWALVRTGNHGRAREAYRQFRERISRDLEMEPSPRTQAAVQRALTSSGSAVGNPEEPSVSRRTRWRTGTLGSYLDQ